MDSITNKSLRGRYLFGQTTSNQRLQNIQHKFYVYLIYQVYSRLIVTFPSDQRKLVIKTRSHE